jgi:hypothetical protein
MEFTPPSPSFRWATVPVCGWACVGGTASFFFFPFFFEDMSAGGRVVNPVPSALRGEPCADLPFLP